MNVTAENFSVVPSPVSRSSEELPSSAIVTLVLWTGCLTISLIGVIVPYGRPIAAAQSETVLKAEILQVELTADPLPPIVHRPQPIALQPPATLTQPVVPEVPLMISVAEPSAVAFALPVEGAMTVVEPARAPVAAAAVMTAPAPVAPVVRNITYGQGEGRQPAPEYPMRARREGQEGVVGIRFTVGEDGRVLAAETSAACPWRLLNEAATRVVRERWRFPPGSLRVYEVSIRFQLTN